jgi:hypothetical protein
LPLFVLILEEPPALPTRATNAHVYSALAQNIDRQLHLVILGDKVQSSVIAPFVRALTPEGLADDPAVGITAMSAREWRAQITDAWEYAMESEQRPWKSWVVALPSQSLATMIGAHDNFNRRILEGLNEELERAGRDGAFKISKVLESCRFFSGANHEAWTEGHDRMLREIRQNLPPSLIAGAPPLARYLGLAAEHEPYAGFFDRATRRITDRAAPKEERILWFQALKRLFCRSTENLGPWFRFSFSRLYTAAAIGANRFEIDTFKDLFNYEIDTAESPLGRFKAIDDPTADVYDWVRALTPFNLIDLTAEHEPHRWMLVLTATLGEPLKPTMGGQRSQVLLRLIEKLNVSHDETTPLRSSVFMLRVRVVQTRSESGIELGLGGLDQ